MSYTQRSLEELNIMDDFLMNAIATDEEVGEPFCRDVLSVCLQREIGAIRIVSQRSIPALTPELRGIRMDVEVIEDISSKNGLPAMIYVLTFLNYDPFGYDYMMYTVRNQCVEVPELQYEDGLCYIYFYTGGTKGGTPEIKALLNYFCQSTQGNATDDTTKRIHDYTKKVKVQPEVRDAYMTLEDLIYYRQQEAAEKAAKEATEEATKTATRSTMIQCICDLLNEYGDIPESVMNKLNQEDDNEVLTGWHKLAAKVDSIEEFIDKM